MLTHYFRLQYRRLRRLFGYEKAIRHRPTGVMKVIILGGFGYGNTGDEAQLGANLQLWKKVFPHADTTVLSPNPAYTLAQHGVHSEYASRVIFFNANAEPHFKASDAVFKRRFWLVWLRMLVNVHLMRAGFSPVFASAEEAALLLTLHRADIVHVSGGGFLTGMTRSRLWDTCLIMKLCQKLGTPYFLTGQTIGIFQSAPDRWLAKSGLRGATLISLRDPIDSKQELLQLGLPDRKLVPTVDDALFCEKASEEETHQALVMSSIAPGKPYLCVNYHYWGMSDHVKQQSSQRLANLLDDFLGTCELQVLFVPMVAADVAPQQAVLQLMKHKAHLLQYSYDYRLTRGVIADATLMISFKHHPLIFSLGEAVPSLSVSLDSYYYRKNYGAMLNFDQQSYCAHGEKFYQQETNLLLQRLYSNRKTVSETLAAKNLGYFQHRSDIFRTATHQLGISHLHQTSL